MRDTSKNPTAKRVEENVHNLPITSLAVAGLVGAGVMALLTVASPLIRNK